MAGNTFGTYFRITTWGESHGKALGVVIDGCPAGLSLCEADIQAFLDRRKPGQTRYATPRKEADEVNILSGVFEGRTTGTPICLLYTSYFKDGSSVGAGNHFAVPVQITGGYLGLSGLPFGAPFLHFFIGNLHIQTVFRDVDADDISLFHQCDRAAHRCLRAHMADGSSSGCAAEAAVRDQGDLSLIHI